MHKLITIARLSVLKAGSFEKSQLPFFGSTSSAPSPNSGADSGSRTGTIFFSMLSTCAFQKGLYEFETTKMPSPSSLRSKIIFCGLNRAIILIAEAKPGRISSSLIKNLGEHPEDKKPVRVMKGKFGPYIKYKSINATIPEEKDPNEITMDDALILIEKRKEYDKNKKRKR